MNMYCVEALKDKLSKLNTISSQDVDVVIVLDVIVLVDVPITSALSSDQYIVIVTSQVGFQFLYIHTETLDSPQATVVVND